MKLLSPTLLFTLGFLLSGVAWAQSASDDFFTECPAFSGQELTALRWEPVRAPGMLFCRGIRTDGSEAFALTFSRESPFSPRGANRAEVSYFNGEKVQWYKGSIATDRDALVREALIDFGDRHILHISMRADDEQALARQQSAVLALPLPSQKFTRGN